ncbi:hypothetical protein CAC42_6071 [Sphaceloma murrayae]|uniref:Proteasome subunit beta n=1 Tax=Sphaceloma murrayae TaxID=2082308 RepID=A0A2K1QV80_9PEZI|nr:hypothetical protein CAC42_6071 [Sphaceloma murrayae]
MELTSSSISISRASSSTSSTPQPHSSRPSHTIPEEVLLGITGKDYTIIAASKAAMRGATILKSSDDKTRELNEHNLIAFSGEAGDTVQFAEFIQANIRLYSTRNSTSLPPSATSSFIRTELASSLRSRSPYTVNLLLGGFDTSTGKPELYWIDYLASCAKVPYAAHGYAQYYCLSILDKHHHPDIDLETGLKLLAMCSEELRRRLPIDFKGLIVKVVDKSGIREVELKEKEKVFAP